MLRLKLEQANVKPDPPFVYDGEPNFMTYQEWVLKVKDWLCHGYVWWKHRVSQLKKYLSGQTFLFFMWDVVHEPQKWTLAQFLENLFDYCFPTNFRQVQQERFGCFTQHGHPI